MTISNRNPFTETWNEQKYRLPFLKLSTGPPLKLCSSFPPVQFVTTRSQLLAPTVQIGEWTYSYNGNSSKQQTSSRDLAVLRELYNIIFRVTHFSARSVTPWRLRYFLYTRINLQHLQRTLVCVRTNRDARSLGKRLIVLYNNWESLCWWK